jgi:hypothetical protein
VVLVAGAGGSAAAAVAAAHNRPIHHIHESRRRGIMSIIWTPPDGKDFSV